MRKTPLQRHTPMKRTGFKTPTPDMAKATRAKKPLPSKPKRGKEASLKTILAKADLAAAAFCKSLGRCEAGSYVDPTGKKIQCSGRLEWAHIKSRGQLFIRHDPRNCACLCNAHHRHFTNHPDHWYAFIRDFKPGTWDYLNAQLLDRRDCKVKLPLRAVYLGWIEFYKAGTE